MIHQITSLAISCGWSLLLWGSSSLLVHAQDGDMPPFMVDNVSTVERDLQYSISTCTEPLKTGLKIVDICYPGVGTSGVIEGGDYDTLYRFRGKGRWIFDSCEPYNNKRNSDTLLSVGDDATRTCQKYNDDSRGFSECGSLARLLFNAPDNGWYLVQPEWPNNDIISGFDFAWEGECDCDEDYDMDGVGVCVDQCPDTPPGVAVHPESGCSAEQSDPDGDGFCDTGYIAGPSCVSEDLCPGSTVGADVDENGCDDSQSLPWDVVFLADESYDMQLEIKGVREQVAILFDELTVATGGNFRGSFVRFGPQSKYADPVTMQQAFTRDSRLFSDKANEYNYGGWFSDTGAQAIVETAENSAGGVALSPNFPTSRGFCTVLFSRSEPGSMKSTALDALIENSANLFAVVDSEDSLEYNDLTNFLYDVADLSIRVPEADREATRAALRASLIQDILDHCHCARPTVDVQDMFHVMVGLNDQENGILSGSAVDPDGETLSYLWETTCLDSSGNALTISNPDSATIAWLETPSGTPPQECTVSFKAAKVCGWRTKTSLVIIADPSVGRFVNGAGLLASPAGSLASQPILSGEARFSFRARFPAGSLIPRGSLSLRWRTDTGVIRFRSSSLAWLYITPNGCARFQGEGIGLQVENMRGGGGLRQGTPLNFWLTTCDVGSPGPGEPEDFVRIQLWEGDGNSLDFGGDETFWYDNMLGITPSYDDTLFNVTAIERGNVNVHS